MGNPNLLERSGDEGDPLDFILELSDERVIEYKIALSFGHSDWGEVEFDRPGESLLDLDPFGLAVELHQGLIAIGTVKFLTVLSGLPGVVWVFDVLLGDVDAVVGNLAVLEHILDCDLDARGLVHRTAHCLQFP